MKKPHRLDFSAFHLQTDELIKRKSIENFHANRSSSLKKALRKQGNFNAFSMPTEVIANNKSIMILNFPCQLKYFLEKSIEKAGKFRCFFHAI